RLSLVDVVPGEVRALGGTEHLLAGVGELLEEFQHPRRRAGDLPRLLAFAAAVRHRLVGGEVYGPLPPPPEQLLPQPLAVVPLEVLQGAQDWLALAHSERRHPVR